MIIFLLASAEFWSWNRLDANLKKENLFKYYFQKSLTVGQAQARTKFKPAVGLEYKKRPIIVFGCSFAYGWALENNQTFEVKLSEQTKRPVYNRAVIGWGTQHMLRQLKHEPALDQIKDPEYVIYVFILDHLRRAISIIFEKGSGFYRGFFAPYLTYIEKDGKLQERKHPLHFLYRSLFVEEYLLRTTERLLSRERDKAIKIVTLQFMESKAIIERKYPHAKTVILVYEDEAYRSDSFDVDAMWEYLESKGFIVVKTSRLTGKDLSLLEYRISETDVHPNEHAWDIIVPALVRKLSIK